MNNKLIPIVLTLVVGIILAGSVLVPVLNDATKTEGTFTNEGLYYLDYIPEGESHTLVFTPGTGWTFDGDAFTDVPNDCTILGTNDLVIRGDGRARGLYSSSGSAAINLTVTTNTLVGTFGSSTVDFTYDKIIVAIPDTSDLVMKASTTVATVLEDSEIEAYGYTIITTTSEANNNMVLHINGTLKDGFTITATPSGSGITVDYAIENITTDAVAIDEYIGLYKLTKITFDVVVTYEGEEYVTSCTYNRIIVPAEVTAELSQHLTPGQIALMGAIPVLVIVALLVVAVGVVARRND